MKQEQMIRVLINRATEMLKDADIVSIYKSFKTEDEAKDWILKAALATLIIPIDERMKKHSINQKTAGNGIFPSPAG